VNLPWQDANAGATEKTVEEEDDEDESSRNRAKEEQVRSSIEITWLEI
jgi:hypothetical protein